MGWIAKWRADERGATAIEYALIAGVISIGILSAAMSLGTSLGGIFEAVVAGF